MCCAKKRQKYLLFLPFFHPFNFGAQNKNTEDSKRQPFVAVHNDYPITSLHNYLKLIDRLGLIQKQVVQLEMQQLQNCLKTVFLPSHFFLPLTTFEKLEGCEFLANSFVNSSMMFFSFNFYDSCTIFMLEMSLSFSTSALRDSWVELLMLWVLFEELRDTASSYRQRDTMRPTNSSLTLLAYCSCKLSWSQRVAWCLRDDSCSSACFTCAAKCAFWADNSVNCCFKALCQPSLLPINSLLAPS